MKNLFNRVLAWVWVKVLCMPQSSAEQVIKPVEQIPGREYGTPIRMYPYQPMEPVGEESPLAADKKPQASMSAKKRARLKKQEKNRRKRSK